MSETMKVEPLMTEPHVAIELKEHQKDTETMAQMNVSRVDQTMEISIQDIGYTISRTEKQGRGPFAPKSVIERKILNGVSGLFRPGRLTAVMGASGAGKTSLLNVLAGEVTTGKISGKVSVNGEQVNTKQMKEMSGFVFQDDVILDTMTVREAITMSAILRLPKSITLTEKEKRVDDLLKLLRLQKAADTIIGSSTNKGISGGERKRTALAMEMVTNPSILFLDEPTSGLDTFTAFNVVDILRNLSRTGRTVIATIHQPSSDIFHMFDDLCLLAEGRIMYFGPIDGVVPYFSELGYACPTYSNPADYLFMSILNTEKQAIGKQKDTGSDEKERIKGLLDRWVNHPINEKLKQAALESKGGFVKQASRFKSDFGTQFNYLLGRAAKNAVRNKFIIRVKFFQSMFIALLIGIIYFNIPRFAALQYVQNISGALFFVCINTFMNSAIGVLNVFGSEKAVFVREYTNGFYSLPAYFLSKTIVEMPHQIIFPIIQAVVIYFMVNLNLAYWYQIFVFAAALVLISNCGTSLGLFFASVFENLQIALAVTPMTIIPLMIFSGLFVNIGALDPWFVWIAWISPIRYGYEVLIKNQFNGWSVSYDMVTVTPSGPKTTTVTLTGPDQVDRMGFNDGIDTGYCLLILLGIYVALVFLAYFALSRTVKSKKN